LKISVLGSTGSIGVSTLDVVRRNGYEITALAAGQNVTALEAQARRFRPKIAALFDEKAAADLRVRLADTDITVLGGEAGVLKAASAETDIVVNAIVGIAGLKPTLAAVENCRRLALANKETIVCAGELVLSRAAALGCEIIPVDSEHSAIFQCLELNRKNYKKILLTASGGPFYGKSRQELSKVTPADALKHPNWDMGAKITIDSATMMNKGLEYIEAMRLFGAEPEQIEVIIHPESVIHSMVELEDGTVLAQLAEPDMRLPIQYALTYPERLSCPVQPLNLISRGRLSFLPPDNETFPALPLAMAAAKAGSGTCTLLNGANEVACRAFLAGQIGFCDITDICAEVIERLNPTRGMSVDEIFETDGAARRLAGRLAEKRGIRR